MSDPNGRIYDVNLTVDKNMIKAITGRLSDMSGPLSSVSRQKLADIEKQFKNFVDPDGNKWSPLKPSTLRTKRVNKDKILTRYGKLRSSFYTKVDKHNLTIRTDNEYAVYHQFGTVKMAKRLILKFTDSDYKNLRKLVLAWAKRRK